MEIACNTEFSVTVLWQFQKAIVTHLAMRTYLLQFVQCSIMT